MDNLGLLEITEWEPCCGVICIRHWSVSLMLPCAWI